jgi:Bacterial protein of unknown function (DUF899)
MSVAQTLSPARELVATNTAHFPNESAVYRTARNALLVEEIELRRHIEHVAAQRRALPAGWPTAIKRGGSRYGPKSQRCIRSDRRKRS